jgi:hypothetical protein
MQKTFFIILTFLLHGCVSVRPYPLCFCNEKPSDIQYQKIEKDITEILLKYAGSDNTVAFSADHRWVFVKTSNNENKKIVKIWARIACIGKKNVDAQLEINKRCIEYINQMLKSKNYFISEDKRQGYLYCGGEPY